MSIKADEISIYSKEIKNLYNSKTAFGNVKLIDLLEKIKEVERSGEDCEGCDGTGTIEHDCDCPYCDHKEEDCPDCDGTGKQEL